VQCLGKPVAIIELNKIFVKVSQVGPHFKVALTILQLLRYFDIQLVDPTKPWKSFCAYIFMQSEMFVRIMRSESKDY
jgi:hypothetical protein